MEQKSGFRLGKAYLKTVYCHPTYVTYMKSTSREMPDCIGLNHGSAPYQLCDFKQVAEPLWASVSLNENEDGNTSACVGKFIIMRIKQIGL